MAYQFAHTQTFSRRGTEAGKSKGKGRGVTVGSRSISDIVNEAIRKEGFCPHVESPKDPAILHGVSPTEIPQLIEQRIRQAKQLFPEQLKGKGKGIRKDQHILEGAVFSHPAQSADLVDDEVREQYQRWRDDVVKWVKRDFDDRGLEFVSAVEHLDEAHPHIHAYGIPKPTQSNPRMDAKLCHAGHAARAAEPNRNAKNTAYKRAMRQWQDDHHAAIGERHGLLRFGPKRQRLDRKTYTIQKEAAKDLARKIQVSEKMGDLTNDVGALRQEKQALEAEVKGLKAKLKGLYDMAKAEATKIVSDPIQYIKDHFMKPVEDERDQYKAQNEKLQRQLNAIRNTRDERTRIVVENVLFEVEQGHDRTPKNVSESPSESHSNDFIPR